MSTRHIITLILYVLFVNLFFFQPIGGFGTALFLVGNLVFLATYFLQSTLKNPKTVAIAGAAIIVLAIIELQRANISTGFLLLVSCLVILASLFYLLVNQLDSFRAVSEFLLLAPRTAWRYVRSVIPGIQSLGKSEDTSKVGQRLSGLPIKSLLIGVVVSLPILLILIQLLSGADPIFKHTIENSVSENTLNRIISHSILSLLIFIGSLPLLNITYPPFKSPLRFLRTRNYSIEYSVLMTMVAAVLLLFVVLQSQYIFIPSVEGVDLKQFGFETYSQYVQKGFNEFIAVSLFVFSLLWIGLVALHDRGKKSYLLAVQLVVLAEFATILAAFFRRIWLYQSYHGMTLVRFYGGYFVAVIGILTLTLFGRHLWNRRWIVIESVMLLLAVIGLGLFNIEKYIALHHPPTVNERVDYSYLSRLSADGYDGWKKAYDWSSGVLTEQSVKTSSFSAEDRRQIAYSGLVVQQLLKNSGELIETYGSHDERNTFARQVLDQSLERIDERLRMLDQLLKDVPVSGNIVIVDGIEYNRTTVVDAYTGNQQTLRKLRERVVQTRDELGTKSLKDQKNHVSYNQPWGYWSFNQTFSSSCSQLINCPSTQYTLQEPTSALPMSWYSLSQGAPTNVTQWDKTLLYNYSTAQAYEKMKQEMPIQKLLEMQKQYFSIYEHVVVGAKPEDLAFDADISLNTPFLPPVAQGYY
jgi:hypothetical protein